jgi:hypothetical protein
MTYLAQVVIIVLFLLLVMYVVAFFSALRHGFAGSRSNTFVLLFGAALVLLPMGLWAIWWLVLPNSALNIGPSAAEGFTVLLYGSTVTLPLVLASLIYSIARMVRSRKGLTEADAL